MKKESDELRNQLNYVCYDEVIRVKLQGVWKAYFELEAKAQAFDLADVSNMCCGKCNSKVILKYVHSNEYKCEECGNSW